MSCFVVSDYHVSALVNWGARSGAILGLSPDALAHELASANRSAFSSRYLGRYDSELVPFGGLDRSAGADLAPVAIVKACDCLEYQASAWTCWDRSDVAAHLAAIRAAAQAACLGGRYHAKPWPLPGYDAAAWELVDPAELAAERLAATLASMPEHEVNAIRAALAATRCAA
jgi:hypothetical protein